MSHEWKNKTFAKDTHFFFGVQLHIEKKTDSLSFNRYAITKKKKIMARAVFIFLVSVHAIIPTGMSVLRCVLSILLTPPLAGLILLVGDGLVAAGAWLMRLGRKLAVLAGLLLVALLRALGRAACILLLLGKLVCVLTKLLNYYK